ncbi:MAG: Gfo/Idh/MocA family oxidoreductase [Phycisphaeraceae bacterium]|nr:Gfo/Idh/MocA family oxidoreductase [Phycisphaeraceae bacterium]
MHPITRRRFIGGSLSAVAMMAATGPTLLRAESANNKLGIAYIGVGGQGRAHFGAARGHNCVALCDPDLGRLGDAPNRFPDAKIYQDYRRMFDELERRIDAVIISTPDHHHAPAVMRALRAGKHVYCEKPLTFNVHEARVIAQETARRKVATQMGNQGHANQGNRRVVEWVRAGVLGTITEVHTWTNRPNWPAGIARRPARVPVPSNLDWDAWIGPAPFRDRHENLHPFNWRGWMDFGAGAIGDMGAHTWDCVWWAMDPVAPATIHTIRHEPERNNETFSQRAIHKWQFAARGERPAFDAYWYEGGLKPPVPEEILNDPARPNKQLPGSGSLFIGTKGKLLVTGDYGNSPRLIPEAAMEALSASLRTGDVEVQTIPTSPGHMREWLLACTGRESWDFPKSNFLYAGPLNEAMHLANVAYRVGKEIRWDPENLRCPGAPEADQFIRREYRKGWELGI